MDIQQIVRAVIAELQSIPSDVTTKQSAMNDDNVEIIDFQVQEMGVDAPLNRETIEFARSITPARIGIGRAGVRMKTNHYLQFRIDHAAAQDAVLKDVSEDLLNRLNLPRLSSRAKSLKEYLMDLDSGRQLDDASRLYITKNLDKGLDVQIIVSDGLSSSAVEANIENLLPALQQGLALKNISSGQPIFVKKSRVWLQDDVAKIVNCQIAIILIGERPGLNTDESLSAYIIYRPNEQTVEADRTVISNIHRAGLAPTEAGAYLADLLEDMLRLKCSGVEFSKKRNV